MLLVLKEKKSALENFNEFQPFEAEEDCTQALSLEKDNVKALFRRAQARKVHYQFNYLALHIMI